MGKSVSRYFASLQQKPPAVSGIVTNVALDADTGQQRYMTAQVGSSTIRVPLDVTAPTLGNGDHVRLEQYGSPAAADYRLAGVSAGARPASGAYTVLNQQDLGGQTYQGGDTIFGALSGGNVWIEYATGNLYHRIGNQVYGIDFADGSTLIGHAAKVGSTWTPDGPNVYTTATQLALRNGTTAAITLGTDGVVQATTRVVAGTGNNVGVLDGADATYRLYAGHATPASAPFRVTQAGVLTATNASITGTIDANAGTIGSLTVDGTLTIGTGGSVKSANYAAGLAGWQVDNSGSAEFNNVRVRGAIQSAVLTYGSINAVGGSLLTLDGDILAADMTAADDSLLVTAWYTGFPTNAILRLKNGTQDEWLRVVSRTDNTYTVTRDLAGIYASGANPAWKKGSAVISYGLATTTAGGLLQTATLTGAPYLSVFVNGATPWAGTIEQVRLGNLGSGHWGLQSGDGSVVVDQYGVNVGDGLAVLDADGITAVAGQIGGWYLTNAAGVYTLQNDAAAPTVVMSANGYAGTPYLAFGATPPASPVIGTGVFINRYGVFGIQSNKPNFVLANQALSSGWWNGETFAAGSVLFGDNSAGQANMLRDAADGRVKFRSGQTVKSYIDTDGTLITMAGGNNLFGYVAGLVSSLPNSIAAGSYVLLNYQLSTSGETHHDKLYRLYVVIGNAGNGMIASHDVFAFSSGGYLLDHGWNETQGKYNYDTYVFTGYYSINTDYSAPGAVSGTWGMRLLIYNRNASALAVRAYLVKVWEG
jgi:hypothetical protein